MEARSDELTSIAMCSLECDIRVILRLCTEAFRRLHALRDDARLQTKFDTSKCHDKLTLTETSPKLVCKNVHVKSQSQMNEGYALLFDGGIDVVSALRKDYDHKYGETP
jgi:hypothetical protein